MLVVVVIAVAVLDEPFEHRARVDGLDRQRGHGELAQDRRAVLILITTDQA